MLNKSIFSSTKLFGEMLAHKKARGRIKLVGTINSPPNNTESQTHQFHGNRHTNSGESLNMNVKYHLNNLGVGVTQNVSGITHYFYYNDTQLQMTINPTYTATEEWKNEFEVVCAPMSDE